MILHTWVEYAGVHSSWNIYRSRGKGCRVSRVELAPDGAARYFFSKKNSHTKKKLTHEFCGELAPDGAARY